MKMSSVHVLPTLLLLICTAAMVIQAQTVNNVHITALAMNDPPLVFYDPTAVGNARFTGLYIDYWNYIVKNMGTNVTYTLQLWNGSFSAAVDYVATGAVDLAVSDFTITQPRLTKVDFTVPLNPNGLAIMTLAQSSSVDALAFLQPFSPTMWVALVFTAVLFAAVIWVFDRFSPYGRRVNPPSNFVESSALMLGQSVHSERPTSWSTRIAMIGYYLFVLIVIATYIANLTVTLYIQAQFSTTSVQNVQELRSSHLIFAVDQDSANSAYFINSSSVFLTSMVPFMRQYPTKAEMVTALHQGTIQAIVGDQIPLQYLAQQKPCDLQVTDSIFYTTYLALPVQKNSPYLAAINSAITQGEQTGTFDDLISYWQTVTSDCSSKTVSTRIEPSYLAGLWYQLLIVVAFALVAFVFEIVIGRKSDSDSWIAKFCGSGGVSNRDGVNLEMNELKSQSSNA